MDGLGSWLFFALHQPAGLMSNTNRLWLQLSNGAKTNVETTLDSREKFAWVTEHVLRLRSPRVSGKRTIQFYL